MPESTAPALKTQRESLPGKGGNTRVLVASPDYLARHGQPDSIEELARRNCICFYRNGELFNRWRLFHQGQQREVTLSGDRAADDGALVRHWAVQGHGIAYKSRLDVEGDRKRRPCPVLIPFL